MVSSTTGTIMMIIYILGILVFLPFGVGPAILGWAFFMAPGLGIIFVSIVDGDWIYFIIGMVCFLIGAIPTYLDIKAEKKRFNEMVGKD